VQGEDRVNKAGSGKSLGTKRGRRSCRIRSDRIVRIDSRDMHLKL
jgi:hypothetical protein